MAYRTQQRKLLANFLMEHPDRFFTPQEVYEEIGGEAISLSAVYRNMATLEKDGSVVRRPSGNKNENAYRFIHGKNCAGHIHMVCEKCGRITHISHELSDTVEKSLFASGFKLDKARTMLYGVCDECSK